MGGRSLPASFGGAPRKAKKAPAKPRKRRVIKMAEAYVDGRVVQYPIKLTGSQNAREHWAVAGRRRASEKAAARLVCGQMTRPANLDGLAVVMVRLSPHHQPLDNDNLTASCKATRDGIAAWLGIDDGDPRVTWCCEQERAPWGCRIRILPAGVS